MVRQADFAPIFAFWCSILTLKLSKLQATKGEYDVGIHFKRLFEK
jgi:hypothetical protein